MQFFCRRVNGYPFVLKHDPAIEGAPLAWRGVCLALIAQPPLQRLFFISMLFASLFRSLLRHGIRVAR